MAAREDRRRAALRVLEIFREAGADPQAMAALADVLRKYEQGALSPQEAFYAVTGLAMYWLVDLTPDQVDELARLFGVA